MILEEIVQRNLWRELKWLIATSDIVVFGYLNVTLCSQIDSYYVSDEPIHLQGITQGT
jgi:hypothetical protein